MDCGDGVECFAISANSRNIVYEQRRLWRIEIVPRWLGGNCTELPADVGFISYTAQSTNHAITGMDLPAVPVDLPNLLWSGQLPNGSQTLRTQETFNAYEYSRWHDGGV